MGIGNVRLIQTTWGHLSDQAHRLAVYMGAIAKDDEREFYGGRELLAIGLGRPLPKEPADDDDSAEAVEARKVRKATFEAVRRRLRELEQTGVIQLTRRPSPGKPAKYKLNPLCNDPRLVWPVTDHTESGPSAPSTDHTTSGPLPLPTAHTQRGERPTPGVPTGHTQRADGPHQAWGKEEEDVTKDLGEESSGEVNGTSTGSARPREDWYALARDALHGRPIDEPPFDPYDDNEDAPPDEEAAS